MTKSIRLIAALGAVLFVTGGLAACGGGVSGNDVVAVDGSNAISKAAFAHWKQQPDGYRRTVKHWIRTGKQEETRERRFLLFIKHAEKDQRLPQFVSPPGKK